MHVREVLPRDVIPSIDEPVFGPRYFGDGTDEVIVIESTPARAYPVRILNYHEIVNDELTGDEQPDRETDPLGATTDQSWPIVVTWCPICASAIVYDRRVDEQVLTFGTSGKLADDALVMYDRETESEWKQSLGQAIDGPLEGQNLTVVPASIMSWQQFRANYPNGLVLQPDHGSQDDPRGASSREVYEMAPYERYAAAAGFGLREMRGEGRERTWDRDDIDAKTVVLGIIHEGDAIGFPIPQVQAAGGVVIDTVGNLDVVVVSTAGDIHAFEDPGYDFELRNETLYADGAAWDPTTGQSDDGRSLARVPSRRLYAFAWQDDHGPENFYGLGER